MSDNLAEKDWWFDKYWDSRTPHQHIQVPYVGLESMESALKAGMIPEAHFLISVVMELQKWRKHAVNCQHFTATSEKEKPRRCKT